MSRVPAMGGLGQDPSAGRAAFLWACGLDVAVRKPGNVSRASAGHGMQAAAFLSSAEAAAGPLFTPGLAVGARIEAAVAATWQAVGCNTNLGIVLLCAPLAVAWERLRDNTGADFDRLNFDRPELNQPDPDRASTTVGAAHAGVGAAVGVDLAALKTALGAVLATLDLDDARATYRAIAQANPGGLGRAAAQDVAAPPSVNLRAAMGLAAERDSIARQYANGFADVFACGLPALTEPRRRGNLAGAVQTVFMTFLAGWPDSHIVRKLGSGVAQSVTADAASWLARLRADPALGESAAFAA
ncbi:MAG TPA: triphosphoribosyl-dephospho-CoA synthase, partial [Rhodocyclaceae bacterium]|nr:triphosphoribosyl-dephospho-CoA synthase [Rhodocyclaceae bacterium]